MYSNTNALPKQAQILKMLIASLLILVWAGCTSAPSVTPEKFVLNFIEKHIPMTDLSVADFYVNEEQDGIIHRIQAFIETNREKGTLKSLSAATYDFSDIKVEVVDQKEEYILDEEVNFLKVAATGNYTKTTDGKTELLVEDEIIIIEALAGTWKVTENINPWKY